jgi:hypothetical protein
MSCKPRLTEDPESEASGVAIGRTCSKISPALSFGPFVHQSKEVETIMNVSIRQLILLIWTKHVLLLFRCALVFLPLAMPRLAMAQAGTLVQFTFESSHPTVSEAAGMWITNIPAEFGTGTASAWHQGACEYTSPAGNSSHRSFSAANWTVGDFWQFACSSVGASNLSVSFDLVASGYGPANFQLQYSTDGLTFINYGTPYTVGRNGGLTDVSPPYWSGLIYHPNSHYSVDLSSIAALNNQANIWFRLIDTSATSTGGGTVISNGVARVDNFGLGSGNGSGCVTWSSPGPIHYGFPLDTNHELNATACMPGTFVYSPPEGTVLPAGQHTLTAVFTPSNSLIAPSTNTVSLSVHRAPLTVSAYNSARTVGNANPVFTGSIYGLMNGDNLTASYSCFADSGSPPGDYAIVPSPIDTNSLLANYIVVTNTGTLTVSTGPIEEIILAQWNFNTNQPPVTVAGGQWYINGPAVLGSGTASALHQRPTSYFGLPIDAANFALASTNSNVGDLWQFDFPVNGATNLTLEVHRASSAPGPKFHNLFIGHGPIINTLNLEDPYVYCPPSATLGVYSAHSTLPASIYASSVINTHGLSALVGATNLTVMLQDSSTTNANGGIVGPEGVDALYSVTVYGAVPLPPGTPVISWSKPQPVTYGTPLSSTQLNATASTNGTFIYSPAAGTVLPVGTNTLSVVFIPSPSGYFTVSNTVNLVVQYAANPTLIHPIVLSPGMFQFTISNIGPSTNYTVLFTPDLASPLSNWTVIGSASLVSPGLYQFTDSNATAGKGFYTVRSP